MHSPRDLVKEYLTLWYSIKLQGYKTVTALVLYKITRSQNKRKHTKVKKWQEITVERL